MFRIKMDRTRTAWMMAAWIVVSALTAWANYPQAVLDDKPTGYWRLDETSGMLAKNVGAVGRAADGTFVNGVFLGRDGAMAGSFAIGIGDASPHPCIDVPYNAKFNPRSFSLEMWVKVTGGSQTYRGALSARIAAGQTRNGYIIYAGQDDRWQFWLGADDQGWQIVNGPAVEMNQWVHLVATYDADSRTQKLYVNAADPVTQTWEHPMAVNTKAPLRIGAGDTGLHAMFPFRGDIDEVAIYNQVLTPQQVQAHYAAGTDASAR